MTEALENPPEPDSVTDTQLFHTAAELAHAMSGALLETFGLRQRVPFDGEMRNYLVEAARVAFMDCVLEDVPYATSLEKFFGPAERDKPGYDQTRLVLETMYRPLWTFMEGAKLCSSGVVRQEGGPDV